MKYYNVNGIKFGLNYQFPDYLDDNIEEYETDECEVNHYIETKIVDSISIPSDLPKIKFNNREVYVDDDKERVYIYDKGFPILMIETDVEFKRSVLSLVKDTKGSSEMEYIYTGIMFMELCLYHSIQSLHGSAISYNNQAIIFSGPSGTGKSTHVEYWKELEPLIEIINDDKPLLNLKGDQIMVSGSPWSGKTKVNMNTSLPLHSIVFLEQGTANKIEVLSEDEKAIQIMRNINRPRQDELWDKVSDIIEYMIQEIPMYKASVKNDIEAAVAVRNKLGV